MSAPDIKFAVGENPEGSPRPIGNGCLPQVPDRASNVVDNKVDLFQMA